MDRGLTPCLACSTGVPRDASACPECGAELDGRDWRRLCLGGLGMALTLTVVFAPVGLVLLWRARRRSPATETGWAREAGGRLDGRPRSVVRAFLRLDRPSTNESEPGQMVGRPADRDRP